MSSKPKLCVRPHDIIYIARRYAESNSAKTQNEASSSSSPRNNQDQSSTENPQPLVAQSPPTSTRKNNHNVEVELLLNGVQKLKPLRKNSPSQKNKSPRQHRQKLPPLSDDSEKADGDENNKKQNPLSPHPPPALIPPATIDASSKTTTRRRHSYLSYNEASPIAKLSHANREKHRDEHGVVTSNPVHVHRIGDSEKEQQKQQQKQQPQQQQQSHEVENQGRTFKSSKSNNTSKKQMQPKTQEQAKEISDKNEVINNQTTKKEDDGETENQQSEPHQQHQERRPRRNSTKQAICLYSAPTIKHKITETLANASYNQKDNNENSHRSASFEEANNNNNLLSSSSIGSPNNNNSNNQSQRPRRVSMIVNDDGDDSKKEKTEQTESSSKMLKQKSPSPPSSMVHEQEKTTNNIEKTEPEKSSVPASATTTTKVIDKKNESTLATTAASLVTLKAKSKLIILPKKNQDDTKSKQQQQQQQTMATTSQQKKQKRNQAVHHRNSFSDLSLVRQYLEIEKDERVTPQEIRDMLKHSVTPLALLAHWNAVTSSRSTEVISENSNNLISKWIFGDGTAVFHEKLMQSQHQLGIVVMSDSAGLSKLSKTRPLIEVLKLIHEPKLVVARKLSEFLASTDAFPSHLQRLETKDKIITIGEPKFVGNWVADNTASFFPLMVVEKMKIGDNDEYDDDFELDEGENDKKREEAFYKMFMTKVIETMIEAQNEIAEKCKVQIGIAIHFANFFALGNEIEDEEGKKDDGQKTSVIPRRLKSVTLQGHELEHVEHLAEDYTCGGEIVVTKNNFERFFNNNNNNNSSFDVVERSLEQNKEDLIGFRIVPKVVNKQNDERNYKLNSDIFYPAGFSSDFFQFLSKYNSDEISHHKDEVAHLVQVGIFILVKFKSVEHELLLDQIAQRIFVRDQVKMICDRINLTEISVMVKSDIAASKSESGNNNHDDNNIVDFSKYSPGKITLIKCNGDIAIVKATHQNSALRFVFSVQERFRKIGNSFSCSFGAYSGESFVFDLSYRVTVRLNGGGDERKQQNNSKLKNAKNVSTERVIQDFDVAGAPVNISSKLAEDFGEDGIFFAEEIFSDQHQQNKNNESDQKPDKENERIVVAHYGRLRSNTKSEEVQISQFQKEFEKKSDEHEGEKGINNDNTQQKLSQQIRQILKPKEIVVLGHPVKIEKSGIIIRAFKLQEDKEEEQEVDKEQKGSK